MALPKLITKPAAWIARTVFAKALPLLFAVSLGVGVAMKECDRLRAIEEREKEKKKGKSAEVKARERSC